MRIYFKHLIVSLLTAFVSAGISPLVASGQQPSYMTVEVGQLAVTHILFTSDLTYVTLASPDIIRARVVDSSKNMLALQAVSEFAFSTTISALESNGTMHTFYIRYNSSPSVLLIDTRSGSMAQGGSVNTQIRPEEMAQNTQPQAQSQSQPQVQVQNQGQTATVVTTQQGRVVMRGENGSGQKAQQSSGRRASSGQQHQQQGGSRNGVNVTSTETSNFGRGNAPTIEEVMRKPRNLYHITDKCYGMEVDCINIFAYSDQLYIVLSVSNKSDIGYDAGDAQFTVETRKVSSKTLQSDKPWWPKSSYGKLACAPNSMTKIGYTIPKLTLQKNEVLKVYIYEKDGTRNLFLTLDADDVNYAKSPL